MAPDDSRGSIPAWAGEPGTGREIIALAMVYPRVAGEPCSRICKRGGEWVYPRVGGGTCGTWKRSTSMSGLSPRGRGNLRYVEAQHVHVRSIPAWAGEPLRPDELRAVARVYPRVGGGTTVL